jgi:hypothetical protein
VHSQESFHFTDKNYHGIDDVSVDDGRYGTNPTSKNYDRFLPAFAILIPKLQVE